MTEVDLLALNAGAEKRIHLHLTYLEAELLLGLLDARVKGTEVEESMVKGVRRHLKNRLDREAKRLEEVV